MHAMVVEGRADSPARVAGAYRHWVQEAETTTPGWAGTTAGVTAAGRFIAVTSYDEQDGQSPRRPWTSSGRGGGRDGPAEVTLRTGTVVHRDLDRLAGVVGFVQVVQGRVSSAEQARVPLGELEAALRVHLPALVGTVTVTHPDGGFTRVLHFTSEAEARAGERDLPPEVRRRDEVARRLLVGPVTFLDLRSPWVRIPERRVRRRRPLDAQAPGDRPGVP